MAVIYRKPGNRDLEQVIGFHRTVQGELNRLAFVTAVRAERLLMTQPKERTGDSQIEIAHEKIDWYVVLDDTRGLDAAMSIEFGRAGYIDTDGTIKSVMEPLYILTDAANLPRKGKRLPATTPYKRNQKRIDNAALKKRRAKRKKKGT